MRASSRQDLPRVPTAGRRVPILLSAECWLTLFVFAGILKGNPAIAALALPDLTVLFGLLSLAALMLESWWVHALPWPDLHWVDVWLALCCAVLAAGALRNVHFQYGLAKAVRFICLAVVAAYGIPRCVSKLRGSAEAPFSTVVLVMSILGTTFSAAAFMGVAGASSISFGGTYQSWGYFAGAAAICTLTLFAEHDGVRPRLLLSCALALQAAAVGTSGARGPLLALSAILVLTAFGLLDILPKRARFLVGLLGAAALGLALFLSPTASRERVSLLVAENKGASIELRATGYREALDMFARHPLLGAGTGAFALQDPDLLYPHNVFLEVLAENGLLGALVFAGFAVTALWQAWAARRRAATPRARAYVSGTLLLCLFFGLEAMFSGDIANRELFFALGLLTTMAAGGRSCERAGRVAPLCSDRLTRSPRATRGR